MSSGQSRRRLHAWLTKSLQCIGRSCSSETEVSQGQEAEKTSLGIRRWNGLFNISKGEDRPSRFLHRNNSFYFVFDNCALEKKPNCDF